MHLRASRERCLEAIFLIFFRDSEFVKMPRRVLVIGAGCSGLVALKECREEGLDVVCVEALPWIGGLWKFTESEGHSSVYR